MKNFDLIVLGGGTAGLTVAHRAADSGWQVALIEPLLLGGTYTNWGCTPTKTMIYSAKILDTVKKSAQFGVTSADLTVDWARVVAKKDEVIDRMRLSHRTSIEQSTNIALFQGDASFESPTHVRVGEKILRGKKILIATGSRNVIPPIKGLEQVDYLTSTEALELKELPKSLLIIGGGTIAVEFAQLYARFGVEVTVLERAPRIISMVEPEIAAELQRVLTLENITIATGISGIQRVEEKNRQITVVASGEGAERRYTVDKLMLAVGRKPNTDMLNLDQAGVETDHQGFVKIDDSLKTNVPGIWAAGDVRGGLMLTNTAWHDAFLLNRNFFHGEEISTAGRLVPYAIFTDPEIASVGLTEKAARDAGYLVEVSLYPTDRTGRTGMMGQKKGLIKVISEQISGKVLGTHILGPSAGEVVHEFLAGMRFGVTINDLRDILHIDPTAVVGLRHDISDRSLTNDLD